VPKDSSQLAPPEESLGHRPPAIALTRTQFAKARGCKLRLQTRVESARLQRLKLKYDEQLPSLAFNLKLCPYTKSCSKAGVPISDADVTELFRKHGGGRGKAALALEVGTSTYCPPCHQTCFEILFPESKGIP